jgi:hypothetical protein
LKQKCENLEFTFPSECEKLKFTVAYPLRKDRLKQNHINPRKKKLIPKLSGEVPIVLRKNVKLDV